MFFTAGVMPACCDPPGGGGIYRLITSMCPSPSRWPHSQAQRKQRRGTQSQKYLGQVKAVTRVSGKITASPQATNKILQRFGKTKMCLLRQQKRP